MVYTHHLVLHQKRVLAGAELQGDTAGDPCAAIHLRPQAAPPVAAAAAKVRAAAAACSTQLAPPSPTHLSLPLRLPPPLGHKPRRALHRRRPPGLDPAFSSPDLRYPARIQSGGFASSPPPLAPG